MNRIEIRKQSNHIVIVNDRYSNGVTCLDPSRVPDIGVDYTYLQWSDIDWENKFYVDLNNLVQPFTAEQLNIISNLVLNWVQPLGQEGNPTLDQAKEILIGRLKNMFDNNMRTLINTSDYEANTWTKQEMEARAWNTDNTVSTPFIDSLLFSRNNGETKQSLVTRIIANADAYNKSYATGLGIFQMQVKAANTAASIDEVNNLYIKYEIPLT